jgi:hypothetical protein
MRAQPAIEGVYLENGPSGANTFLLSGRQAMELFPKRFRGLELILHA